MDYKVILTEIALYMKPYFYKILRVLVASALLVPNPVLNTLFVVQAKTSTYAPRTAAVVYDLKRDRLLYSRNYTARRYPASLTKLMTLYIIFNALKNAQLSFDSFIEISSEAAKQPPSKLGLQPYTRITIRKALEAVVVKSANDVAYALAEGIAGNEKQFVALMNRMAKRLGMAHTHFANPTGLPNLSNYSTVQDLLILTKALIRTFPEYYSFFGMDSFEYNGQTIPTHNTLLNKLDGIDGIKTGYIYRSGYNIIASLKRNDLHLLTIYIGARSVSERDAMAKKLLMKYTDQAGTRNSPNPPPLQYASRDTASSAQAQTRNRGNLDHFVNKTTPRQKHLLASPSMEYLDRDHESVLSRKNNSVQDSSTKGSWSIQIGSAPNLNGATALEKKVKQALPELAHYKKTIYSIGSKPSHRYWLRYKGLVSKQRAYSICGRIMKHRLTCNVIKN